MGRAPCCEKIGLKKGPWTSEEDQKLIHYIQTNGYGNWRTLPKNAGLQRCGKSCRLRWTNYLRPGIKRGSFSSQEEDTIIQLHTILGNKWSAIAARLPGRTDNEIKNYWNTNIRKRLLRMGIDPVTHTFRLDLLRLSTILNNSSSSISSQMKSSRLLRMHEQQPLIINQQMIMRLDSSILSSHTQNPNYDINPHQRPHNLISPPLIAQTCQLQTPFDQDVTLITHHDHALMHVENNFSENLISGFGSPGNCCKVNDEWQQSHIGSPFTTTTDTYVPLENYGYYGSGQPVVDPTRSIIGDF